ncbi:MAG: uncharacterized protein A8A55_1833 [Amphiamblys sp. WSBS2006]|nr:MAG: uncharacterized protein A8A55_1833 [Amphiamblys sp. WSBS2006]
MLSIRANFASCGDILFFDRPGYIEITPNTTVSDIEIELLDVKRREILRDMERKGIHAAPEHLEETTERRRSEQSGNNGTTPEPRPVDSLVLTVAELSAGPVLLSQKTAVYLPTTGLSDALFFRLLNKTKVVFGGTVSLFEHFDEKDCIREGMGVEYREEVRLSSQVIENSVRFMENITRIPENSICVGRMKHLVLNGYAVSILPLLLLDEDNEIEALYLSGGRRECVSEILGTRDSSIWLGKVKSLGLVGYAVNILPKLNLQDSEIEGLYLNAGMREYVSETLGAGDRSIWLGKVKSLGLVGYAASILPKLNLQDSEIEELYLSGGRRECVSEILGTRDSSIWLGKVKSPRLESYAVNILPKLNLQGSEIEGLYLSAGRRECVSEILSVKDGTIWLGRVESLVLYGYAANILPKVNLQDSEIKELYLSAGRRECVSETLVAKDNSIWIGKVKSLKLERHAIKILPKLWLHKDNMIDSLVIIRVGIDMLLKKDYWILGKIKTARSALEVLLPLKTGAPKTEPLLGPGMDGDSASGTTPADGGCCGWKIKQLKMYNSTVYALRGIRSDKSCVLDRFEYTNQGKEKDMSLWFMFRRVYLGKIKQNGLVVPPSIKENLIYTLVDEEGNNPVR